MGPALRVVLRGSAELFSPPCMCRRASSSEKSTACRKAVQRGGAGTFGTGAGVTKQVLTAGEIQKAHASTQAV